MRIKDTIIEIARNNNWPYQDKDNLIKIDAEGEKGNWQTFCKCLEDEKRFAYYSLCPSIVPKENISLMAEVLTRINYGLKVGNFEMDYDTGEIHFKTYVDFHSDEIPTEALAQCMYINILTFDQYFQTLLKFIHSTSRDEESIRKL